MTNLESCIPYYCPTSKNIECCPEHSGWDVCCTKPERHLPEKYAPEWKHFANGQKYCARCAYVNDCRCMWCPRCDQTTGNNTQGHFWAYCKVTRTDREYHMCCPGQCELEKAPVTT